MSNGFRVTVEDLTTGEKQSRVVSEGDYMLIPFAPCYLHSAQRYGNGTVTVTLKGHVPRPVDEVQPRHVPSSPSRAHAHGEVPRG